MVAKDTYVPHIGSGFDFTEITLTKTDEEVKLEGLVFEEVRAFSDDDYCGNPILGKVLRYADERNYDYILSNESNEREARESPSWGLFPVQTETAAAFFSRRR